MIIHIGGVPRVGKNKTAVYLAVSHYSKENSLIKQLIRKKRGLDPIYNNVYSNFPILLDRRKKIYANEISIYDLNGEYRLRENAMIVIDEMPVTFDALDWKDFPKAIGDYLHVHGHYHINSIILVAQHPKRLPNKPRDIAEILWRIKKFKKLPLLPWGRLNAVQYFQFDDYGKPEYIDKKVATYDFEIVKKWCNLKNIHSRYKHDYMYPRIADKPMLEHNEYNALYLSKKQILCNFYGVGKK